MRLAFPGKDCRPASGPLARECPLRIVRISTGSHMRQKSSAATTLALFAKNPRFPAQVLDQGIIYSSMPWRDSHAPVNSADHATHADRRAKQSV